MTIVTVPVVVIARQPRGVDRSDATNPASGEAGASAAREYERRRQAREARVKVRFGRRLGGAFLALSDEPSSQRAWARGAQGERELAKILETIPGICVLQDRRVPGTRANIDHIVIAPAGVFVVDAKLYAGEIRIRDVGGFLKRDERLFVGRQYCSALADKVVWQVEVVARALGSEDGPVPITPVLCFVRGEWPLFRPPTVFRGVRLEGTRSIKSLVGIGSVMGPESIGRLFGLLEEQLPPA